MLGQPDRSAADAAEATDVGERHRAADRSPTCWRPMRGARPAAEPVLLRVHRHPEGQDAGACSAGSNPATGKHEPFHLYSMRQAIEEGFILDVLASYTTYKTYWNLAKTTADDPAYERDEGARRPSPGSCSLHPHNLAQKAEVIVEHFRQHVAAQDRRPGQGDGGHRVPAARGPVPAGARHATAARRATTSASWWRSPARC